MPVPGHVPAALDPDLDSDTWPYLVTVAVAGLQLTLLPPPNLTLPGLASAPATGTLCWSPLPFLGLPCVSLRYGGTGLWLLRHCPALSHGTVLSVAAPRSSRPLLLPDPAVGCSGGAWPPACAGPSLGRREGTATAPVREQEMDR